MDPTIAAGVYPTLVRAMNIQIKCFADIAVEIARGQYCSQIGCPPTREATSSFQYKVLQGTKPLYTGNRGST